MRRPYDLDGTRSLLDAAAMRGYLMFMICSYFAFREQPHERDPNPLLPR
jgi:hypothetical protein